MTPNVLVPSLTGRAPSPGESTGIVRTSPDMWYDHGMTKVAKIAISLPPEQVRQARAAVARGEASSVSGYISAALAAVAPPSEAEGVDTLAAFAADLIAEDGEPSAEARERARRLLAVSEEPD